MADGVGEEIDVDALMNEIEAPTPAEPANPAAAEPAKAVEAPTWDGKQWEFESNGKKVFPDSQEKARTWMSQGFNYSQRMGELNKTHAQRMAEAEQRAKAAADLEQKFSPYAKVDEYARQNPQWWQHVLAQYDQQAKAGNGIDPALAQIVKPLEEKLGKFEQFFGQIEQQRAEEENKRHDTALEQEIQSIREKFPTIDLNAVDPASGKPLEVRILEHAKQIGTHSFTAAFRDYLHDKLIEVAKAEGREAIAKDAQVNAKKGILGKTPAPVKGVQQTGYVRGKSYDALAKEGLAEFGIT